MAFMEVINGTALLKTKWVALCVPRSSPSAITATADTMLTCVHSVSVLRQRRWFTRRLGVSSRCIELDTTNAHICRYAHKGMYAMSETKGWEKKHTWKCITWCRETARGWKIPTSKLMKEWNSFFVISTLSDLNNKRKYIILNDRCTSSHLFIVNLSFELSVFWLDYCAISCFYRWNIWKILIENYINKP